MYSMQKLTIIILTQILINTISIILLCYFNDEINQKQQHNIKIFLYF